MASELETYFRSNTKRLIHKWEHYFDIYERHFDRYRGKQIVVVEIGVSQGGSLQMWKHYFGDKAMIHGIDVDPNCKQFEEERIKIFIGSQSDRKFLREVKRKIPPIDILIDDGGHTMRQQITTYQELFDHVKSDGVYLCEDLHTSYWLKWGGGHQRRGTFIEFCKGLIDRLHAFHSEQSSLRPDGFTRSVGSIHFYDSIVVIEKQPRGAPVHSKTGEATFSRARKRNLTQKIIKGGGDVMLNAINRTLRALRLPGFIWR